MRVWVRILLLEVVVGIGLCFCLAWVSLRQITISYEISRLQQVIQKKKELHNKLVLEKSFLFSPNNLRRLGKRLHLSMPSPERIREIK